MGFCPRPWKRLRVIATLLAGCTAGTPVFASEADLHPDAAWSAPAPLELSLAAVNHAEAMARFAQGIFLEEAEGPEAALAAYLRVLELDPGYLHLAVRVGQEYLRRGEVARAIAILKDTAKARPDEFLPPLLLGAVYMRHLQKPSLAELQVRQALAIAPENFFAIEMLWEIHQFAGQAARADRVLADALAATGSNPGYWLDLADFLRRMPGGIDDARFQQIQQALAKAVANTGDNAQTLARAADLHVLLGAIEPAADLYRAAHAIDPSIPNLEEKLTAALIENGQNDEAEPLLRQMLEKNPRNLALCDRLAAISRQKGDYEQELGFRQRALILAPHHPERHLEVTDLLLGLGRFELAIHYLEEARNRFPRSGLFTYQMALAQRRAGQPAAAVGFFETALIEATPGAADYISADFYFEYGVAAEQTGLYERAADLFQKTIAMDPANAARASNYLGYMWVDRNEHLDEAERLIRNALAVEPANGAYVDSLGWLYFRRGEYAEALIYLLHAAELIEEPDPVVFDHIGDTYHHLGRAPEALLYWQKALQLDPENSTLVEKIDAASDRMAHSTPASAPLP